VPKAAYRSDFREKHRNMSAVRVRSWEPSVLTLDHCDQWRIAMLTVAYWRQNEKTVSQTVAVLTLNGSHKYNAFSTRLSAVRKIDV